MINVFTVVLIVNLKNYRRSDVYGIYYLVIIVENFVIDVNSLLIKSHFY